LHDERSSEHHGESNPKETSGSCRAANGASAEEEVERTKRGNPTVEQWAAMSTVPASTSVVHFAAAIVRTSAWDAPCAAAICKALHASRSHPCSKKIDVSD
jgi:hypothetical protein